jgi:chemosensory pili system protein ChpA (sensor histidine kinase/response regulator)
MNDVHLPFDELNDGELSDDDLAILRAFEAMESWPPAPETAADAPGKPAVTNSLAESEHRITSVLAQDDEMMFIFLEEADEDLALMRQALRLLEEGGTNNPVRFISLQRAGHKLRGTAGAVDFSLTSLVAGQIEDIAERVSQRVLAPPTALLALSSAFTALEHCLQQIKASRQEPEEREVLLAALAATYQDLGIDLTVPAQRRPRPESSSVTRPMPAIFQDEIPQVYTDDLDGPINDLEDDLKTATVHIRAQTPQEHASAAALPNIRVDARRLEKLTMHTEHLVEQRSVLENSLQQVEVALQEFQDAQARLQQLEPLLPLFLTNDVVRRSPADLSTSPSSLISRILGESSLRRHHERRNKARPTSSTASGAHEAHEGVWDEMNMEHYNGKDNLVRSLKDAMVDVNMTCMHLQTAYTHFAQLQQEYLTRISSLRRDSLSMRLAPLSTLVPRLERVVKMSALGQPVHFNVTGEHIEIDQEVLEQLAPPLIQLFRTCMADAFLLENVADLEKPEGPRIWLHIRERGSEITLEVGFSITIQGGAVDAIREALQSLGGHLSLWRNAMGGVSFLLHIPRAQGAAQCLLVHTGSQQLVVPFVQVQRVLDQRQDAQALPANVYHLNELLGFPAPGAPLLETHSRPILVIALDHPQREIGVAVDQVLDEAELIVKPLKPYLQRPGIPGAAVDGKGQVVLMVDLPALIEQYIRNQTRQQNAKLQQVSPGGSYRPDQVRILVADDAVYLRHSVRQTLQHERYLVTEARDGMEALERLQENVPAICLLDIEMPNLNGYDVLNMIRSTPALTNIKVIMLTSRSSEKHRLRALELGADAYLTKPCPQELLLATVRRLVAERVNQ